jgi:hypothetical protein
MVVGSDRPMPMRPHAIANSIHQSNSSFHEPLLNGDTHRRATAGGKAFG